MVLDMQEEDFEEAVNRAARALVSIEHGKQGSFIVTPILYPTGASVVVWIDRAFPRYIVTDFGFGAREVELSGGESRSFIKVGGAIAGAAGIELSDKSEFRVVVDANQLEGAIKMVARCSQETCSVIHQRLAEKARDNAASLLFTKLVRVFGAPSVAKEVEFMGASRTPWHVTALVRSDGREALFEPVSPHFPSVAATLAKFGDIRQLEAPPARTAVVTKSGEYKTWIAALSQISNVVEREAADQTFQRAANA